MLSAHKHNRVASALERDEHVQRSAVCDDIMPSSLAAAVRLVTVIIIYIFLHAVKRECVVCV